MNEKKEKLNWFLFFMFVGVFGTLEMLWGVTHGYTFTAALGSICMFLGFFLGGVEAEYLVTEIGNERDGVSQQVRE